MQMHVIPEKKEQTIVGIFAPHKPVWAWTYSRMSSIPGELWSHVSAHYGGKSNSQIE